MSKKKILILPLLFIWIPLVAQFQWGLQTGNNLSMPGYSNLEAYQGDVLLRYAVGIYGRKVIKKGFKGRFISPIRNGVIALDWGLNFVRTGYAYQYADFSNTTEQWLIQFPVLLVYYDTQNILTPRKWKRKGLATFTRFGVKPYLIPRKTVQKNMIKGDYGFEESARFGGWNSMIFLSGGLLRQYRNGNSVALELAANIGFKNTATGELQYRQLNGNVLEASFFKHSGNYFSLNLLYLFDIGNLSRPVRKRLPPIIYSPRNLDGGY